MGAHATLHRYRVRAALLALSLHSGGVKLRRSLVLQIVLPLQAALRRLVGSRAPSRPFAARMKE